MNQCDNFGETLLGHAVKLDHTDNVKLLLEAGADAKAAKPSTLFCDVPLWEALRNGNLQVVKLLLDAGADVNQAEADDRGRKGHRDMPIWEALKQCNPHMMKLLLDAGADANCTKAGGGTGVSHLWDEASFSTRQIEAGIKLLFAAGANINVHHRNAGLFRFKQFPLGDYDEHGPLAPLVFAAGEEVHIRLPDENLCYGPEKTYFPPGWEAVALKNQCRKVIRKHLLTLDPHTNLFIRAPQLQMTNQRAGLPAKLVSYLLSEQSLDVDWDSVPLLHRRIYLGRRH